MCWQIFQRYFFSSFVLRPIFQMIKLNSHHSFLSHPSISTWKLSHLFFFQICMSLSFTSPWFASGGLIGVFLLKWCFGARPTKEPLSNVIFFGQPKSIEKSLKRSVIRITEFVVQKHLLWFEQNFWNLRLLKHIFSRQLIRVH